MRLLSFLALAGALIVLGVTGVWAQGEATPRDGVVTPTAGGPATGSDSVEQRRAPPAPPELPANVQVEPQRLSGFWTSTRPARGGAYRYRLLIIGVTLALFMLGFTVWLVRRMTRSQGAAEDADALSP